MTRTVTVDGRTLAYETWGDPSGLPVLALHGTPGCRLNRIPDEDGTTAAGAFVVTYDRPGYGRSDRHRGRSVVDCVADVRAIADDLAFTRPWGFELSEVRVPVQVWYGETDVLVPAAHGAWLAANVPDAQVTVDRAGGHMGDPAERLAHLRSLVEAARQVSRRAWDSNPRQVAL